MSNLFKWGGRKDVEPSASASAVVAAADPVQHSKVLPKVLAALSHVQGPALMDLGPVVGGNVSFFGEQLACRLFVEDLFAVVEAHGRRGDRDGLPSALLARLQRPAGTIDGILCWDLFDYLDRPTSTALAGHLVSLLKPGGMLYGFFGATQGELSHYNRFLVDGPDTLRLKSVPASPTRRNVLVVRDINRMFEGLTTIESVLLKTNARETLFRKPQPAA